MRFIIYIYFFFYAFINASGAYDHGTSTGKGKFEIDITWNPMNYFKHGQSYLVFGYGITNKLGGKIVFSVRSDKIRLSKKKNTLKTNEILCLVRSVEYHGSWIKIVLDAEDTEEMTVVIPEEEYNANTIKKREKVTASWNVSDAIKL